MTRFAHNTGLELNRGTCGIHSNLSGLWVTDDFGNMPEVATFQAVYSAMGFEWLIEAPRRGEWNNGWKD